MSLADVATILRRVLRLDPRIEKPAETQPYQRVFNRREVVLPSGRFASMSPILMIDVLSSEDPNGLIHMMKLASCCVAIDGVPLGLMETLHMEVSDFAPINKMLLAESVEIDRLVKGVA